MTGNESETPAPARRKRGMRDMAWGILALIFIATLILSALSMARYTEMVKASILTHVLTEQTAELMLDDGGGLESVNMTLKFTIVNPSQKSVRAWVISYKGWVRDIPTELRLDNTRQKIDGTLAVNGTVQMYYPVFVAPYSFDSPNVVIIPGNSNATITRHLTLNYSNYPAIMSNFADIHNYSSSNDLELQWIHYTSAILFIEDSKLGGLTNNADLIRRFDGIDITPGEGGAGP